MPGHSRAALAAYPEYACNGEEQPVPGLWGIFDDIYCAKKETIDFMKDIMEEVLELFPSEYIHIGGDEAPKTRWKTCDDCQRIIEENGLKDEHELQSYFIRQMDAFLTSKGRKLIGWDEILEGGLSPNAAVMSWRGEEGGIEAAKQGHYVVMSPTTYCYFDYYQSSHSIEPLAIGGYLPLEKVYAYEPIPKALSKEEEQFVLGGQANLWTEYIPDMQHLEYMTFPRALALMQSLWCHEKPSYEKFLESYLIYHEDYLSRHNVNFAKSIHYPELVVKRAEGGVNVRFKGATKDAQFKVMTKTSGHSDFSNHIVMGESDSVYFERLSSREEESVKFKLTSDAFEDTVIYAFELTSAVGLPIEMITQPHPKYDHNGSLNLVDGIKGSIPWKGSEWLGFSNSKIEFIIDLEKIQRVSALKMGFLENNGSWIYLPQNVVISSSKNGKRWKRATITQVSEVNMQDDRFLFNIEAQARYLKVEINAMDMIPEGMDGGGHAPWTFIDEVEILYAHE